MSREQRMWGPREQDACADSANRSEVAELSSELRHAEKIPGIEIIAAFLLIFLIFTNCKQYNSK